FGCLSNLVLTGYQAVLVFYLVKVIGLSPGMTGVMLSLTSLGGGLGALGARTSAVPPGQHRGHRRPPGRRHPRRPGRQPSRRPAGTMDYADRAGTQLTRPAARAAADTPRPAIDEAPDTAPQPSPPPNGLTQGTRHHVSPEPNPRTH